MAKYALTEEHRATLEPWADMCIARALNTTPLTDADHAEIRSAMAALYRAADLTPPPPERIVIVPSPFVAVAAAGFASYIWQHRGEAATDAATRAATGAATDAATRAATWAATEASTWASTRASTRAATWDAWYQQGMPFAAMAERLFGIHAHAAIQHLSTAGIQHGSEVFGYAGWIAWFRHIAKLPLDYSKWDAYERLSHYNLRILHPQFAMVLARPVVLTVDDQSRPHNDIGPFCRWADGTGYYAVHGVRVPWWLIEHPERLTAARITAETNAEVRRVMLDRFGFDRFVSESGALPVHADETGTLYRCEMGDDEPLTIVRVRNSTPEPDGTWKHYALRVHPELRPMRRDGTYGEPQTLMARNAVASTFGLTGEAYHPALET